MMKRKLTVGVGMLLVLAAATGVVYAQANEIVKADIPFQFTLNEKAMPAGNYEISMADPEDPTVWVFRSTSGEAEEMADTNTKQAESPAPQTELVFDEVVGHHFLRELWIEGQMDGREIPMSKTEKELEKQGTPKHQRRVPATHAAHHSHGS